MLRSFGAPSCKDRTHEFQDLVKSLERSEVELCSDKFANLSAAEKALASHS